MRKFLVTMIALLWSLSLHAQMTTIQFTPEWQLYTNVQWSVTRNGQRIDVVDEQRVFHYKTPTEYLERIPWNEVLRAGTVSFLLREKGDSYGRDVVSTRVWLETQNLQYGQAEVWVGDDRFGAMIEIKQLPVQFVKIVSLVSHTEMGSILFKPNGVVVLTYNTEEIPVRPSRALFLTVCALNEWYKRESDNWTGDKGGETWQENDN
jgi:hypothetical protein